VDVEKVLMIKAGKIIKKAICLAYFKNNKI
jgi:hypothetical protein